MSSFTGFPKESLRFMANLDRNNKKEWFEAHREEYESYFVEPAKAFVGELGEKIASFAPQVNGEPRINGSIFRINRDVRFSKDKTPYNPQLSLIFWHGPKKKEAPSSLCLRLTAKKLVVAVGQYEFDKSALTRYRKAVDKERSGKALEGAIKQLSRAGFELYGESYKRVPKGFDPEHTRADLLRHKGLMVSMNLGLPEELHSKKLLTLAARHLRKSLPVHNWLVENC